MLNIRLTFFDVFYVDNLNWTRFPYKEINLINNAQHWTAIGCANVNRLKCRTIDLIYIHYVKI